MKHTLPQILEAGVQAAITECYATDGSAQQITLQSTRREFEGEFTVVTFPLTRVAKKKPDEIANDLGQYLKANIAEVADYNVIKGFLNLVIGDAYWKEFLLSEAIKDGFGRAAKNDQTVVVEFASPNTNKPLHLGHVRNILLGWSASQLLEAAGYDVKKVQIINDRGIAICKSMLAWHAGEHRHQARPLRRQLLRPLRAKVPGGVQSMATNGSRAGYFPAIRQGGRSRRSLLQELQQEVL
jgi:arginyl-tRNA synthetase